MNSLFARLMFAFALVILIAIAIIFVIVNQTTTNEFRAYTFRGGTTTLEQIARELSAYYAARGGWQGIDQYFAQTFGAGRGRGAPMMAGVALLLADSNGTIIASRDGANVGQKATSAQLAASLPVQANGRNVGALIASSQNLAAFDAQQQEFLTRVNLSLLLAGAVAGALALLFGFFLFYQITAPLNALTTAARKIAAGDFTARVANPRGDEIGQVGRAFNAMAEALAQSETARRNMIADIAHELRNPLGVLQGQLEAMLDGVFPTTSEQIASLHDETLLLARLVGDLRDLALADAGQLQITRQPADVRALIERTAGAFALQAHEQNIALTIHCAENLPRANVDAQRIEQVLRNLIGNALRHTPDGGRVSVQCSVLSEQTLGVGGQRSAVSVRVSDTGSGISSEDLPRVFERFWRGDKARTRAGSGAGLGLAIAKQLIRAHNGAMGVESEAGRGATFWFTLPV
ncbi:MAG: HAMP domain-containing protein [Chloroflexi bacterium]|nr:HAMP domain-containing protein [Chloroflexota bacterium]